MGNSFGNLVKKVDKAFTRFAKSKAALPVLFGCVAVVAIAAVTVYLTTSTSPSVGSSGSLSFSTSQGASTSASADQTGSEDSSYSSTTIDVEQYTDTVLHESADAGEEYIANTLFLGDSNTYRYMNYGFADLTNAVGVVGMGVGSIEKLGCVKFKKYSDYVSIPKALPIMQPQRVVFGFGTNNLGGGVDAYISTYEKAIKKCYKAYPYFDIIVTAIPPVDINTTYTNVKMSTVDKFNAALVEMCEENGWKFLNTSEVLKDPKTGYAITEYTISDGLHLSLDGCTALFEYIRTHAYETEDTRPKPLAAVPARDETPPDLITEDPLKTNNPSSSTAAVPTVSVYFAAASGGYISGEIDQTIEVGTATTSVTAKGNDGYYFVGWNCSHEGLSDSYSDSVTFTAPKDINAFGGVVATAYFAQAHTVNFVLSGDVAGAKLSATSALVASNSGSATTKITLQEGYTAAIESCVSTSGTSSAAIKDGIVTVSAVGSATTVTIKIKGEATATPSPSATPTPDASATPSLDPSATPTATATQTVKPTATATATPTEEPDVTTAPTAAPTVDPTPEPTVAATPEPTVAATPEPTVAVTPEPTVATDPTQPPEGEVVVE